jgi:phosphate:Na+ symporter
MVSMGQGFFFLGLDFMKTGMMDMVQKIDLRYLANYSPVIFMLVGLLITSLIQSSSATIAILLSALYANAINLNSATAMVLGAEIGTTLKFILVSINGSAAQKRVAFGNFLFNVIVSILVLLFLGPVNYFITGIVGIKNKLIALVFFQSLINLGGIILFYPFLHPFANLLEKFFRKKDENTFFVQKVTAGNIDLALASFEKETRYFMEYVINYCTNIFGITLSNTTITLSKKFINNTQEGKYDFIKHLHGKLLSDYIELQNVSSAKEEAIKSGELISAVRNSMYAAKSMKDSLYDAAMLRNSSNDAKYDFYVQAVKRTEIFYLKVTQILEIKNSLEYFDELVALQKNIQDGYTQTLHSLYKKGFMASLNEIEISSLINFNRQIYTSYKSMVLSLKDFLLSEKETEYFDGLPGFIN